MGQPNKHRAFLNRKEDFKKWWKLSVCRRLGKYHKCSICSGKQERRMTHHSRKKASRRANKVLNWED
jgi:hypothetical protein